MTRKLPSLKSLGENVNVESSPTSPAWQPSSPVMLFTLRVAAAFLLFREDFGEKIDDGCGLFSA